MALRTVAENSVKLCHVSMVCMLGVCRARGLQLARTALPGQLDVDMCGSQRNWALSLSSSYIHASGGVVGGGAVGASSQLQES